VEFRKETLKNGVRLIAVPMPYLESVTAMVGIGAGGRYEDARTQGIAHFTEHMLFHGTEKRPSSLAISSELESLGAHFNAFTDKEITAYHVKAEARNLSKIMDVLIDIIFHSRFDQREIEREARVITEELRMYRDEPRNWVQTLADRLLYGEHPLGWEILGTEETLKAIRREDFLDYLDRWYRPGNLVVAIAGRLEEDYFGGVSGLLTDREAQPVERPREFVVSQSEPRVLLERRKIDQTHFVLGVRAYPRSHPKREALEVLTTILGGGMSSRLFQEVRDRRGLAYYVGADWQDFSDTGALLVSAGVNNQKVEEAVAVVVEELIKLRDNLVPAAELRKGKEMLRGSLVMSLESTNGAGFYFLGQEVLDRRIETPEERLAKIDAVTSADLQAVAEELFTPKGLNLALVGPFSEPNLLQKILEIEEK